MITASRLLIWLSGMLLAPLLPGIVNRTKAFFAGRRGPHLLQTYFDIWKLFHKGAVYSRTTTFIFSAGPIISLAALIGAAAFVPLGSIGAPVIFGGDVILFVYLLGLARFLTVIAALDTGSSFEGMGASREVWYSALTEPALLLGLAVLGKETGSLSLSGMLLALSTDIWKTSGPAFILLAVTFFIILLSENSRIPVDDPNTHLELTMIHEVMVLDHGGPDFGFIIYGGALKLWIFATLLVGVMVPVRTGNILLDGAAALLGIVAVGIMVGTIESSMARLRLMRVPQLLIAANALSFLALILTLR